MSTEKVSNYFWLPKKQIIDYITNDLSETKTDISNVYELFEHSPHLPLATYKTTWNNANLLEKPFDFFYAYNSLEKVNHLELYISSIFDHCPKGFICNTSPMIEVLKDVQEHPFGDKCKYSGHVLNRFFLWTETETNTLHILPKLNIAEYFTFDQNLIDKFIKLANDYPFYWNNYYEWDHGIGIQPKFKFYNAASDFTVDGNYAELIQKALNKSYEHSNNLLTKINAVLNTN